MKKPLDMIKVVILVILLPFSISKPLHKIAKRSIVNDLLFSERWRELYNYFENHCSDNTKNMILKWTTDCIQVCDDNAKELYLDRRGNAWDIGLGSEDQKYGVGVTRPYDDTDLYLGDACPINITAKSLIHFKKTNDLHDPYAVICNEKGVVEFLSLRFSHCPFGQDYPNATPPPARTENGDCVLSYNNETTVLEHGQYHTGQLHQGVDTVCGYEYCCHGYLRLFRGTCGLTDHCDRVDF